MSILCILFGHQTLEYRHVLHHGAEYMEWRKGPVDGIGRIHCTLKAGCPRCGETYDAGYIHLSEKHMPEQP